MQALLGLVQIKGNSFKNNQSKTSVVCWLKRRRLNYWF